MSNKLSIRLYLNQHHNNINNYKGSGLPKFQKFKDRIFTGYYHEGIEEIINNIPRLLIRLQECVHSNNITLLNIIKLYGEFNIKITEDLILELNVSEIDKVREYNRSRNIYCSKRNPEEFDELYEDIKQKGIQKEGRIRLSRNEKYEVAAILGEGNHRLAVAKLLGISTMPIAIRYT